MQIDQVVLNPDEVSRIQWLRGFLCFYVYCFHFFTDLVKISDPLAPIVHLVFHEGYVAVQLFFALSGFLVTKSYVDLLKSHPTSSLKTFYIRRAFRLLPTWIVALMIYSLFLFPTDLKTFFWNLFFIFGLGPFRIEDLIITPSWSLYVEILFYIFLPLIVIILRKNWFLPFLIIYLCIHHLGHKFMSHPPSLFLYTPFNSFTYFFMGLGCYFLVTSLRTQPVHRLFFLSLLIFLGLTTHFVDHKPQLLECYVLLCFLFIFSSTARVQRPFHRLICSLGERCYSFYLMHIFAIAMAKSIFGGLFEISTFDTFSLMCLFGLSTFLALSLGLALYEMIESRATLWGKKVFP